MTAISLGEAIDQARQILHEQGQADGSDPERSAAICRAILQRYPNLPAAHRLLGLSLRQLGDLGGAERAFITALQTDPRDAAALYELGRLAEERGDRETALAYVQAAWEIDPWHPGWRRHVVSLSQSAYGSEGRLQLTRAALASIYCRAGLWERVVDECAGVVGELGERLDLQVLMTLALCREGRFSWAAASSRDVLDRTPNAVDALLLLAEVERRQGNLTEAGWLRERAFAIDPSPERAASLLGFAGAESLAFFRTPEALVELPVEAMESEAASETAMVASVAGDLASRTEDRLIALEHRSDAGDIPELVELPQVPEWVEIETPLADRTIEPAAATAGPAEPEPDVPDAPAEAAAEVELEPAFETPAEVLASAGVENAPVATSSRDEEPDQIIAFEPGDDTDSGTNDQGAAIDSDDAFAPWIPPAMVPSTRLPVEEPSQAGDLAGWQDDDVLEDAIVEDQLESNSQQPEETAPTVQAAAGESISTDAAAELERLRRHYREAPGTAEEIAADLEALIVRFPNSPETPAAHRLLGSIYRKQGKAAQASLHYRMSLAANRRHGE